MPPRHHQVGLQQDLDAARAMQRSLLPQAVPAIPGYLVAFRSDACYEVGGDYIYAGHNSGFLVQPDPEGTSPPHQFVAAGPQLGLLPGMRYASERHGFPPRGAAALLYRRPHRGL
jgi:serine phosphatase RsbU (regulator of sigma subunit)